MLHYDVLRCFVVLQHITWLCCVTMLHDALLHYDALMICYDVLCCITVLQCCVKMCHDALDGQCLKIIIYAYDNKIVLRQTCLY